MSSPTRSASYPGTICRAFISVATHGSCSPRSRMLTASPSPSKTPLSAARCVSMSTTWVSISAMRLAGAVTKTFWAPLQEKQILVAADSTENRRFYDRMGLRTFYVPDAGHPAGACRIWSMFCARYSRSSLSPRMRPRARLLCGLRMNVLNAASQFLEGLGSSHPEVMLDVRIYEVSHTLTHNFGLQYRTSSICSTFPSAPWA